MTLESLIENIEGFRNVRPNDLPALFQSATRPLLSRLASVLVQKGLLDPKVRNTIAVQETEPYKTYLINHLVQTFHSQPSASDGALMQEVATQLQVVEQVAAAFAAPPSAVTPPAAAVAPRNEIEPPSLPTEQAPKRGRRAATPITPEAAGAGGSSERLEAALERVQHLTADVNRVLSLATQGDADNKAIFTDTQHLRQENAQLKKAVAELYVKMGGIQEMLNAILLGQERSMRITLAAAEMSANMPPAQLVEASELDYVGDALRAPNVVTG